MSINTAHITKGWGLGAIYITVINGYEVMFIGQACTSTLIVPRPTPTPLKFEEAKGIIECCIQTRHRVL